MIGRRGACVLGLVLVRTAGAEPCAPRATLAGDAAAVERVAVELRRLGVVTDGPGSPACPAVFAAVRLDRGGIAVAVRDAAERSEGRVVSDPAVAAAWIESWTRDDLELAGAPLPTRPAASGPPAPREAPDAPGNAVVARRGALDRISLAAGVERIWTSDPTSWDGLFAAGCYATGGWCLGARAHYATGSMPAGLTGARRTDLAAIATASYTVPIGRMALSPELGAGVGRLTTARVDGCGAAEAVAVCDPIDPKCQVPPTPTPIAPCRVPGGGTTGAPNPSYYVGDQLRATSWTPRLVGALRVALPLFDRVWLDGAASATYLPTAHAASYLPLVATPAGTKPDSFALPGEPTVAYELGVGLRVGLP